MKHGTLTPYLKVRNTRIKGKFRVEGVRYLKLVKLYQLSQCRAHHLAKKDEFSIYQEIQC